MASASQGIWECLGPWLPLQSQPSSSVVHLLVKRQIPELHPIRLSWARAQDLRLDELLRWFSCALKLKTCCPRSFPHGRGGGMNEGRKEPNKYQSHTGPGPLRSLALSSSPGSQCSKACGILAVPWDFRHRPWGLCTGCPSCLKILSPIATWLLPSLLLSLYPNTTFSMATLFQIETQGLFLLKHTCSTP